MSREKRDAAGEVVRFLQEHTDGWGCRSLWSLRLALAWLPAVPVLRKLLAADPRLELAEDNSGVEYVALAGHRVPVPEPQNPPEPTGFPLL